MITITERLIIINVLFLIDFKWSILGPLIDNNSQLITLSAIIISDLHCICIFGCQSGRQKILHRMIASIPLLQSALNFFLNRILIIRRYAISKVPDYVKRFWTIKRISENAICPYVIVELLYIPLCRLAASRLITEIN